ncbi:MAG: YbaK/EbsC family protein [Candidatus Thermoplasmatota archaeon]
MGKNLKSLKRYLEDEEVDVQFHTFTKSTLTVKDSSVLVDAEPDRIVKSLVFKDENDCFLLAIVSGNKRVDEEKLSKAHGSKVRMAKAREVEKATGYKIGEVPPVSHDIETYIDSKIMDFDKVFAGGGSTHALIEINPKDILNLSDAKISNIGKK